MDFTSDLLWYAFSMALGMAIMFVFNRQPITTAKRRTEEKTVDKTELPSRNVQQEAKLVEPKKAEKDRTRAQQRINDTDEAEEFRNMQIDFTSTVQILKNEKDPKEITVALRGILGVINRCTLPDMRGCNKVAEATTSLLKLDALEKVNQLTNNSDESVKTAASELMAKVIPLIWSM